MFDLTEEQIAAARIVVVDDDALVTSSLSSFFGLELEVEPITFNRSPDAANFIRENQIDMVVSDFLMPDMDGIRLLHVAKEAQPEVPRVLLTGYADKENAIKAINDVGVFQYLEKPWENEQLRQVVLNGLTRLFLVRTLSNKMDQLKNTQQDLAGLKKALVRAFA